MNVSEGTDYKKVCGILSNQCAELEQEIERKKIACVKIRLQRDYLHLVVSRLENQNSKLLEYFNKKNNKNKHNAFLFNKKNNKKLHNVRNLTSLNNFIQNLGEIFSPADHKRLEIIFKIHAQMNYFATIDPDFNDGQTSMYNIKTSMYKQQLVASYNQIFGRDASTDMHLGISDDFTFEKLNKFLQAVDCVIVDIESRNMDERIRKIAESYTSTNSTMKTRIRKLVKSRIHRVDRGNRYSRYD